MARPCGFGVIEEVADEPQVPAAVVSDVVPALFGARTRTQWWDESEINRRPARSIARPVGCRSPSLGPGFGFPLVSQVSESRNVARPTIVVMVPAVSMRRTQLLPVSDSY